MQNLNNLDGETVFVEFLEALHRMSLLPVSLKNWLPVMDNKAPYWQRVLT